MSWGGSVLQLDLKMLLASSPEHLVSAQTARAHHSRWEATSGGSSSFPTLRRDLAHILETDDDGTNGDGITMYNEYQVQRDPQGGRFVGVEVLGRMKDHGDIISPKEFLPHLRSLSPELQLEHALKQASQAVKDLRLFRQAMPLQQAKKLRVSINLSPQLLSHQQLDIIRRFKDVLARSGGSLRDLVVELTEDARLEDEHESIIRDFDQEGAVVSLDDVAAQDGQFALGDLPGLLRKYPFLEVKLDRSLFRPDGSLSRCHQWAIQEVLERDRRVVIEGIEKPEQLDSLHDFLEEVPSMKADHVSWQGFLDEGRPAGVDATVQKFVKNRSGHYTLGPALL